jgi:hypothetical protein
MPHPFLASHHLVGAWNPSYESDAMDAHIQVLLAHARAFRDGRCSDDDVYVWWGRIRSPRRQAPLPHLPGILALDAQLQGDAPAELHLYLTGGSFARIRSRSSRNSDGCAIHATTITPCRSMGAWWTCR